MPSYSPVIHENEDAPFWLHQMGEITLEQIRDSQTSLDSDVALEAHDQMMLEWAGDYNDALARGLFRLYDQQRLERIRQSTGEFNQRFAEMVVQYEERIAELYREPQAAQKEYEWPKESTRRIFTFGALALLPVMLAGEALYRYYF